MNKNFKVMGIIIFKEVELIGKYENNLKFSMFKYLEK